MKCKEIKEMILTDMESLSCTESAREIREHISRCTKCQKFLNTSLDLNNLLQKQATFPDMPQQQQEELAENCIIKLESRIFRTRPVFRAWSPVLEKTLLMGSGALVATILMLFVVNPFRSNKKSPVQPVISIASEHIFTRDIDSLIYSEHECQILAQKYSVVKMRGRSTQSLHLDLDQGGVLVSAEKAFFDTLAIHTPTVTVRTVGTRFGVYRENKSIRAVVVEGAVLIESKFSDDTIQLGAGEEITINITDKTPGAVTAMHQHEHASLGRIFDSISANTELDIPAEKHTAKPTIKAVEPVQHYKDSGLDESKASAQKQLEIAQSMISKGHYKNAGYVLQAYQINYPRLMSDSLYLLTAECFRKAKLYKEALQFFRIAVRSCRLEENIEFAIHHSNMILYSNLRNYETALNGFRDYLLFFPQGNYREVAMYLLYKTSLKLDKTDYALRIVDRFIEEFPKSCRAQEMDKVVNK